jgi:hypothetical protein
VLVAAWLATHWLLRESGVWFDRNTEEVRGAQRDAEYTYRLAVDPPAGKELRLFGLAGWKLDRLIARRTRLLELQYPAFSTSRRPRSMRKPNMRCSNTTPRRLAGRQRTAASPSWCRTAFPPCAWLVEFGTHEQLMAKRGQYSELYSIQAAAYR